MPRRNKNRGRKGSGNKSRRNEGRQGRGYVNVSNGDTRAFSIHSSQNIGRVNATSTYMRGSPFFDRMRMTLVYDETFLFSGAATGYNTFRGNSAFDPDFSGVGSQPLGFDEYSTIYDTYRVFGSRVEVMGTVDGASTAPMVMCLWPTPESTIVSANPDDWVAQTYGRTWEVSNGRPGRVVNEMTTSKMYGRKPDWVEQENSCGATVSANPSQAWFWQLGLFSFDQTTALDVAVTVKVFYDIQFDTLDYGQLSARWRKKRELQDLKFPGGFVRRRRSDSKLQIVDFNTLEVNSLQDGKDSKEPVSTDSKQPSLMRNRISTDSKEQYVDLGVLEEVQTPSKPTVRLSVQNSAKSVKK